MDDVVVYADARKMYTIVSSYVIIAGILAALGFTAQGNIILLVIIYALVALLLLASVYTIRHHSSTRVIMQATREGVTDFSKPEEIITIPWDQIISVQLKSASNNDLMLDVFGYKTSEQLPDLKPEVRKQLEEAGGKAFMTLELSGLWLTHQHMRTTFDKLSALALHYNPNIVIQDYQDPLSKKNERQKSK